MCFGCTLNGKIGWSFVLAAVCIAFSILVGVLWPQLVTGLTHQELRLLKYSTNYKNWIERPFPLYMEFYMFNWTNVENYKTEKPQFEELGPYVFEESAFRVGVEYSEDENVVAFNQTKVWKFREDLSAGSFYDRIYNANPVAATLSYLARLYPDDELVPTLLSLLLDQLSSFYVGHTVQEWIFEGFDERILEWLKLVEESGEIPEGLDIEIPYEKFAWFYERNSSSLYDGRFEMYTGKDDIKNVGLLKTWRGKERVEGLRGDCGKVRGTTGELWPPMEPNQDATFFITDLCRPLSFKREGDLQKHNIKAYRWIGDDKIFDNGAKYEETACWCGAEEEICPAPERGVYNASHCQYGAPVFFSYPHFYLADSSYLNAVEGLKPQKDRHESYIAIEPTTGAPIEVRAQLQLNLFLRHDPQLPYFEDISDIYVPMFWFTQKADLPENLAADIKRLLLLKDLGNWILYTLIAFDIIFAACGAFWVYKFWKMS